MAFRHLGGSAKKALPGQTLLVIHDFEARSPDELSLLKGERIELIERDDDFGDGWYLGKHIYNGRIGLFPEVYTTVTPKVSNLFTATISASSPLARTGSGADLPQIQTITYENQGYDSQNAPSHASHPIETASNEESRALRTTDGATPPPPNTTPPPLRGPASFGMTLTTPNTPTAIATQRSISISMGAIRGPGEESPVMNETLSVIDEHITDMNTPRSSLMVRDRRGTNDSGSEYSNHIDHRLSYIRGHETDEEEREIHSESEVMAWGPEQVAAGLKEIGVEIRHCDVFREQEITGEVLLAMDQASVFMKEFDLGLVGRRLRTWHKIKAFQEEVRNCKSPANTTLNLFGADGSSDDYDPSQKRHTAHASTLSKSSSLIDQPESRQPHLQPEISNFQHKLSPQFPQRHQSETNSTPGSFTFASGRNSPIRPSAASIREINHVRRHSAADFASPLTPNERGGAALFGKAALSPHKKAPSLDRNWTMGSYKPPMNGRPYSAVASPTATSSNGNTFDPSRPEPVESDNTQRELDREYVFGGAGDGKKSRKVLKKLDHASAKHSRQSSYLEEHRPVSTTASRRQSRFGSVDSIRDTVASITSPASKLYHGHSIKSKFRHSSNKDNIAITSDSDIAAVFNPQAVTKLEYEESPGLNINTTSPIPNEDTSSNGSPQSSVRTPRSPTKSRMGLGAISDAVIGGDLAMVGSPISPMSPVKETSAESPTRTGSTTTSAASQNMERESTDASSKGTGGAPGGAGVAPTKAVSRRKPKRATSAYVRGLEPKSPQEQMIGCDYNGWMKKKSSNLMTTWKSRLFVLRGRRLSYYYTESDTEEKGLIDISSHRVLPADHDFITGIHATVTGAKASPVSPSNAQGLTQAGVEAAAQPDPITPKGNSDAIFIFKLVPPRAGLSRAVNFTKPTVHYFAVDNITQGRLWMAALMKATIDRDETKPITTTFQQKTISLVKARALRHRPPALMGRGEKAEVEDAPRSDETGLDILDIASDADGDGPRRRRAGSLNFRTRSKLDQGKESHA